MAEMLLINPRRRRKASRAAPKRRRTSHSRRRRHNPIGALSYSPVRRRRRHAAHRVARRRRNPIVRRAAIGGSLSIANMLKQALIGGVGALGVDVLWGKINPMLPASMQTTATGVGVGDAVKAAFTVLAGKGLNKATRGMSGKIAVFALASQVRDIASAMLPASMPVAGLGYAVPGRVVQGSARIGPNQNITRGVSPLLNRYTRPGATPLLNAAAVGTASQFQPDMSRATALREGVRFT
jgi:hypothetical protein